MTQPGEDNLSKVEELKKRLFSRNYQMKVDHRDNFSPLPSQQVPEAWQGESEKPKLSEQIFMKTSFFKKFFLLNAAAECGIFDALCKWAIRRHPNKSITWVMKKYYHIGSSWTFQGWTKGKDGNKQYQQLFNIAKLPIRRHVKVRGAANPYDPNYVDYFKNRNDKRDRNTWSRLPETAL